MTISSINSITQFHSIIQSGGNIVVGFRQKPCRVCDGIWPVYQKLANEVDGVEYYEVDANEHSDMADEAHVTAIPFFVVWKKGRRITYCDGAKPTMLETVIKDYAAAGVHHGSASGTCKISPISSLTQFHNIVKSGKSIVVGFRSKQCRVCDSIWPTYEKFSTEFASVEFYEVEINEQSAIAEEAGVFSVPFFVVYKKSRKITYCDGAKPKLLETVIKDYAAP